MEEPTLRAGSVTLRPLDDADAAGLVSQMADGESQRWLREVPAAPGPDDARAHVAGAAAGWRDGGVRTLGVQVDGRYAGQVTLRPEGRGGARLGYVLAPWARGRGTMTAAVRLYLTWAFAHWSRLDHAGHGTGPLEVVLWQAFVGNWPSRRVAWSCGFAVEGCVRGLLVRRGVRRDAWVGSLRVGEEMAPRAPWLDVPVLELGPVGDVGPVRLRPHRPDDLPRIAQACSAPSTTLWLAALPSPYTEQDAAEFVESRREEHARADGLHWAVAAGRDDVLLGTVSLMDLRLPSAPGGTAGGGTASGAEIGYWMHPDARGRGVMTAAVRAAARHCLLPVADGGLGAHRLLLRAAEPNAASRRVAEKAGFTPVGRDRDVDRLGDGRVVDLLRYDLLASELHAAWARG